MSLQSVPSVPCPQRPLEHEAVEKLSRAGGEMVLDFSAVGRIDPATARALEALADLAGQSSVRVVLRGVNIDIYKALKLLRLSPKLSFA